MPRARHRAPATTTSMLCDAIAEGVPAGTARRALAAAAIVAVPAAGGVLAASPAQAYVDHGDGTVTVTSGDTVSAIAAGTGRGTQAVLSANGLGWRTTIHPGQVLRLPGAAAATAPKAPAAAPNAASSHGAAVVSTAKKYLGVPYSWSGTTPSGFDCSGLTQYVYKKNGVKLPRFSEDQKRAGVPVAASQARPGDLVAFKGYAHVAIYAGNGYIIDAPHTGASVRMRKLWTDAVNYRRVV